MSDSDTSPRVQEEIEKANATIATPEALSVFQAVPRIIGDLEAIAKTRTTGGEGDYKYPFRSVDQFMNALNPLLALYQVTVCPSGIKHVEYERYAIEKKKGSNTWTQYSFHTKAVVEYTIYGGDGSSMHGCVVAEGFDHGDKASNKCMAFAFKYVVMQVFCVATEDMVKPDDEHHRLTTGDEEDFRNDSNTRSSGGQQSKQPASTNARDTNSDDPDPQVKARQHEGYTRFIRGQIASKGCEERAAIGFLISVGLLQEGQTIDDLKFKPARNLADAAKMTDFVTKVDAFQTPPPPEDNAGGAATTQAGAATDDGDDDLPF